jgi:phage gp45-like
MSDFVRLFRRLGQLVAIGRTTTPTDEAGGAATVQIRINDMVLRDKRPVAQHYGFASALPVGTDVVEICLSGDPSSGIVIATGNQAARPRGMQPGESQMHDDQAQRIYITRTGIVISAPLGLTINGNIVTTGTIVNNGHPVDSTHVHSGIVRGGAVTDPPV